MLIIFGRGQKIKNDKSLGPQTCPNCNHEANLTLAHEKRYFHIFWIPVFFFKGWKVITCPNCGIAKRLDKKEFKELKRA
ncbi:MAG: zinc-ribbon domain-containing protein [Pseudobutyrivibrio sp.]|nr:zinc-ribbon domain-containing protein [Pseudobutyrivibrio sp.]